MRTGCTPYNLVFDSKVVLHLKVQLPSFRVTMQITNPNKNTQVRLAELKALDEHQLMAQ